MADADTAPLVTAQVHDHAAACLRDEPHRLLQLRATVALDAGEDVAGEALAVHPHEHRLVAGHVTAHECQMGLAVERALERVTAEVAPHRGHARVGDVFDELFVAESVPHQVGDRDEPQAVLVRESAQVVAACHLAAVEDQFAQHAGGRASGEAGEVDGGLGVAGALQHTALAGAQREDVPGSIERPCAEVDVGESPQRGGPVARRDAGRGALGEIDADGESSAVRLGVLRRHHHRRQIEIVAAFTGETHADHPGRVPHEERERLGCGGVGGHDQVAFVLAVLVVRDHHDLTAGDGGDRVLDGVESHGHCAAPFST